MFEGKSNNRGSCYASDTRAYGLVGYDVAFTRHQILGENNLFEYLNTVSYTHLRAHET